MSYLRVNNILKFLMIKIQCMCFVASVLLIDGSFASTLYEFYSLSGVILHGSH
jgi:hypothetical protein